MDPLRRYLVEEAVEDYAEGRISRDAAADPVAVATDAAVAPKPIVAVDDPEIVAAPAEFPGDGATLTGYLARPSKAGTFPIVLVCHENRGLTPHIEDVTRRLARAGYVGMAVDLLAREGGTGKHAYDDVPAVLGNAPPERHVQGFLAGLAHARAQPSARGDRVGMTGFCFGGGMTWRVAAALPSPGSASTSRSRGASRG